MSRGICSLVMYHSMCKFCGGQKEGVLPPVVMSRSQKGGHPDAAAAATVRNVSRALKEVIAFEWEGDFKRMARQALKEILHKWLEQEMAEFLGLRPYA